MPFITISHDAATLRLIDFSSATERDAAKTIACRHMRAARERKMRGMQEMRRQICAEARRVRARVRERRDAARGEKSAREVRKDMRARRVRRCYATDDMPPDAALMPVCRSSFEMMLFAVFRDAAMMRAAFSRRRVVRC